MTRAAIDPRAGATAAALVLLTAWCVLAAVRCSARSMARRRMGVHGAARPTSPPWLAARLEEMGVGSPGLGVARLVAGAGVAGLAAALLAGGPALVLLVGLAAAGSAMLAWALLRHRGNELIEAAVPHALDAVGRSLRSGASLLQALDEAARSGPLRLRGDLGLVAVSAARGRGVAGALDDWAAARPLPSVRLAVAALGLGAETGGAQARAVDGVAATIRMRQALAGDARAMAAQARLSAGVIAVAPLVFGVLAAAADPRVGHVLLRTPLGFALLVTGLALDAAGAWWMARITRPAA